MAVSGERSTAKALARRSSHSDSKNQLPQSLERIRQHDAFEKHAQQRVEAIIVGPDTFFVQQRQQLAALAAKYRMPAMYPLQEHVEAGGLMSYGHDVAHNFHLAATYVDRIFRGADPADLAVEQNSKFQLVINGKAAKGLGLSIPSDLLFLADRVIE